MTGKKKSGGGMLAGWADAARAKMGQRPVNPSAATSWMQGNEAGKKATTNIFGKPENKPKKGWFSR
jgi:hypothetical protein